MAKTIQIRNISDDVYAALARRAAGAGVSVPALLRREAIRLALHAEERPRLTMAEWLERAGQRPVNPNITREHTIEALEEIRGPWPDAEGKS